MQQEIFGDEAPLLERAPDEQQQVVGIDGLREEVERAFLHGGDRILDAAEGGHDDDRDVGVDFLRRAQHAEAVALGQPQIRQHQGRLCLLQHPHRFRLVARLEDDVSVTLERMTQHRAQRVLVFDDENLRGDRHAASSQRSQPGGTPERRASSSRSADDFLIRSMSRWTRSISASIFRRSSPILAR